MGGSLHGQCHIGHICTHRQCEFGLGGKVAFRWISSGQEKTDYTFSDLDAD